MSSKDPNAYTETYLPVFFLIDTSSSMGFPDAHKKKPIDTVNGLIPQLVQACRDYPSLDQRLRISLISFSDSVKVDIPMNEVDAFSDNVPVLTPSGGTNFALAFEKLYEEITPAVLGLKTSETVGVYRPTVFFLTDAEDMGNVEARNAAWKKISDAEGFPFSPNFFSFGVGGASPEKLQEFKNKTGFVAVAKESTSIADDLKEILSQLVRSIVSTSTGPEPTGQIQLSPESFDSTKWDLID